MSKVKDFALDVRALDSNEVKYELIIRNAATQGTDRTNAAELQKLLRQEDNLPMYQFGDEDLFNGSVDRLGDLQKQLKDNLRNNEIEVINNIKAKIKHYFDRACRAAFNDERKKIILQGIDLNI